MVMLNERPCTKAVFKELSKAMEERPRQVKAATAKLYPEVDAKTLDLFAEIELKGFKTTPLTPDIMAHEIAFMKAGGQLPPEVGSTPSTVWAAMPRSFTCRRSGFVATRISRSPI